MSSDESLLTSNSLLFIDLKIKLGLRELKFYLFLLSLILNFLTYCFELSFNFLGLVTLNLEIFLQSIDFLESKLSLLLFN